MSKALFDPSADQIAIAIDRYEERSEEVSHVLQQLYPIHERYANVYKRLQTINDKLKHTTLIPFGPHAFIPGQITNTNAFTVHLGDGYYKEMNLAHTVALVEKRLTEVQANILSHQKELASLGHHIKHAYQILGKPTHVPTLGERMGELMTGEKVSKNTTTITRDENQDDEDNDYYSPKPFRVDMNKCGVNDEGDEIVDIVEFFEGDVPGSNRNATTTTTTTTAKPRSSTTKTTTPLSQDEQSISDVFYQSLEKTMKSLEQERQGDKAGDEELERLERELYGIVRDKDGNIINTDADGGADAAIVLPTSAMIADLHNPPKQSTAADFRRDAGLSPHKDDDYDALLAATQQLKKKMNLIEVLDDDDEEQQQQQQHQGQQQSMSQSSSQLSPQTRALKAQQASELILKHMTLDDDGDADADGNMKKKDEDFDHFWKYLGALGELGASDEPITVEKPKTTKATKSSATSQPTKDVPAKEQLKPMITDTVVTRQRPPRKPKAAATAETTTTTTTTTAATTTPATQQEQITPTPPATKEKSSINNTTATATTSAGAPTTTPLSERQALSSVDAYQQYLMSLNAQTTSSFFAQYLDAFGGEGDDDSMYDFEDEDFDDEDYELWEQMHNDMDDIYANVPGLLAATNDPINNSRKQDSANPTNNNHNKTKKSVKFSDMIEEIALEKEDLPTKSMVTPAELHNAIDPDAVDDKQYQRLMWEHLSRTVDQTEQENYASEVEQIIPGEKPVYATFSLGTTYDGEHCLVQKSTNSTLYTSSLAPQAVREKETQKLQELHRKATAEKEKIAAIDPTKTPNSVVDLGGGELKSISKFKQQRLEEQP